MPFKDTKEGQTHFFGDGCKEEHGLPLCTHSEINQIRSGGSDQCGLPVCKNCGTIVIKSHRQELQSFAEQAVQEFRDNAVIAIEEEIEKEMDLMAILGLTKAIDIISKMK